MKILTTNSKLGEGVIVGLRGKGGKRNVAKGLQSGFIQEANP